LKHPVAHAAVPGGYPRHWEAEEGVTTAVREKRKPPVALCRIHAMSELADCGTAS
jgi:hypothetical protein